MTQLTKEKNALSQAVDYIKNNSTTFFVGLGLTLAGIGIGIKLFSQRVHPDLKRVLELRAVIEKSYPNALQSLETLKIQKRIMTEFNNQKDQMHETTPELNMLFLVITRLKLKEINKQQQLRDPFLPPFQQGLFISELEPSHRLIYNKYNIFNNHLLIVTKQFQAQSKQLTESDFRQSLLTLKALGGLLFFNSGPESGSSQPHKHVQVFPTDALELPIIKQIVNFVKEKQQQYNLGKQEILEFPAFNFVHGLVILQPNTSLGTSKKKMFSAYRKILESRVKKIKAVAYNILATEQFILVIARRKEKAFDEISVNAVGFMGSLLFKDEQKLNKYLSLKIKPSSVLEDITYPKNYEPSEEVIFNEEKNPQSERRVNPEKENIKQSVLSEQSKTRDDQK